MVCVCCSQLSLRCLKWGFPTCLGWEEGRKGVGQAGRRGGRKQPGEREKERQEASGDANISYLVMSHDPNSQRLGNIQIIFPVCAQHGLAWRGKWPHAGSCMKGCLSLTPEDHLQTRTVVSWDV